MTVLGRVERGDGYRVWVGGPVPPGADAITLGSLIVVRRRAYASLGWPRLLAHELVHVEQWRRDGALRFAAAYLGSYARWRSRGYGHKAAYRRIPAEVEANWRTRPGSRARARDGMSSRVLR